MILEAPMVGLSPALRPPAAVEWVFKNCCLCCCPLAPLTPSYQTKIKKTFYKHI